MKCRGGEGVTPPGTPSGCPQPRPGHVAVAAAAAAMVIVISQNGGGGMTVALLWRRRRSAPSRVGVTPPAALIGCVLSEAWPRWDAPPTRGALGVSAGGL